MRSQSDDSEDVDAELHPALRDGELHLDDHASDPLSGVLRASIFGVSDGLVSNLALVMGVAGGSGEPGAVALAGVAGLLAGGFSMGAGEYVSMQTQREMLQRELAMEREHIENYPAQEQAQLAAILSKSGVAADQAERMAAQVHERTEHALHFHARVELGIDPESLGAPVRAALASMGSFALGALVPLLPWMLPLGGMLGSLALSGLALFAVGGLATRTTGRHFLAGAFRQLAVGAVSAGVTWWIGRQIGEALLGS